VRFNIARNAALILETRWRLFDLVGNPVVGQVAIRIISRKTLRDPFQQRLTFAWIETLQELLPCNRDPPLQILKIPHHLKRNNPSDQLGSFICFSSIFGTFEEITNSKIQ